MPKKAAKKATDKKGRRTNLWLYAEDLERIMALTKYAYANNHRANDSLVVRAAIAVLAESPSRKFLEALKDASSADQRFKTED